MMSASVLRRRSRRIRESIPNPLKEMRLGLMLLVLMAPMGMISLLDCILVGEDGYSRCPAWWSRILVVASCMSVLFSVL